MMIEQDRTKTEILPPNSVTLSFIYLYGFTKIQARRYWGAGGTSLPLPMFTCYKHRAVCRNAVAKLREQLFLNMKIDNEKSTFYFAKSHFPTF